MSDTNGTTSQPPRCGDCGETFAQAAFGGSALFLAETLRAAAQAAGWMRAGDQWTCNVCVAKSATEPAQGPDVPVPGWDAAVRDLYREFDAAEQEVAAGYGELLDRYDQGVNAIHRQAYRRVEDIFAKAAGAA